MIQSAKNQYAGINPHLNSLLQTPGNLDENRVSLWPTFHTSHLGNIADALNDILPTNYVARAEHSLQVKADYLESGLRVHKPEPDVAIFGQASPLRSESVMVMAEPEIRHLEKTLDLDETFVKAVVIYEAGDAELGKVVTRIELISPSNTPDQGGYRAYRDNRNQALFSGTPLIELHYLHELPYTAMSVRRYPDENGSHPYHIFVSDPRPSVAQGRFHDYGFDVDTAFPEIVIPLAGEETLKFDFGAVYQHTYQRGRWGTYGDGVDYDQLPVRFHTYSPADQARVQSRMKAIADNKPNP